VDYAATSVPQVEIEATPMIDLRAIPLEEIRMDGDARRVVTRIIRSLEDPSPAQAAAFQSSI
jgi:FXSXX-COOH protein